MRLPAEKELRAILNSEMEEAAVLQKERPFL
jgi:hypothetical protein